MGLNFIEVSFFSNEDFKYPFLDVELDVKITSPSNKIITSPAFYKGDKEWAVRFIPKELGDYKLNTISNDNSLNNITKYITIKKLPRVKELHLSKDKKYLICDNKPFFWLSDTWWMGLSGRLDFKDFKYLANVRLEQGFNTIQLVAGLFPDMDSFDKRGENAKGYVWQDDFKDINYNFFNEAERKIEYLYSLGFHIAIVGAWGYYLEKMGLDKIKKHWRYIVARWGVYASVYIGAGEANMPYYLSQNRIKDTKILKDGWSEVLRYLKRIDSYNRLVTLHPIECSLDEITDSSLIDINLLQASHNSYDSINKGKELLKRCSNKKLTIMDEINYEGIFRDNHDSVQRLSFWSAILGGSKGFGYGANGIWQVNQKDAPFGASPSGASWGDIAYLDAINFKGAKDIAKSKEFLEDFEWWELKGADILRPNSNSPKSPICATINNSIYLVYLYEPIAPWDRGYSLVNLDKKYSFEYYFYSPNTHLKSETKTITTNSSGELKIPTPPSLDDYIFVLVKKDKIYSDNKNIANLRKRFLSFLS